DVVVGRRRAAAPQGEGGAEREESDRPAPVARRERPESAATRASSAFGLHDVRLPPPDEQRRAGLCAACARAVKARPPRLRAGFSRLSPAITDAKAPRRSRRSSAMEATRVPGTLIELFLETVERRPRPDLFLRKIQGRWEPLSAARARADVESLALALEDLGLGRGDRVALLSENRYEWPVADLAIVGQGAVTVPIYPTLTAEQCRHILADSEASIVLVSNAAQ